MHRAPVLAVAFAALTGFGATHPRNARADGASEKVVCSAKYQSAQRWRAAGKLTSARVDLLRCAEPTCPAFVSNDCKTWLAEVDDELPTLVYAVLDANGGDLPNAAVRVDGAEVAHATDGLGHPIDPGEHVVDVSAAGESLRQKIVVRVGEKSRRIELRLAVAGVESAVTSASTTRIPTATYALGGVGVAAIAVGSVLWITGSNAARTYNADCATIGCTEAQRDHARDQLAAGDIAWGVGLAAGIGAVAVFLLGHDSRPAPSISIGPSGVSVAGRF